MSNVIRTTPISASNVLIHAKLSREVEKVTFPITTYDNVLNKPEVLTDVTEKIGAPFHLLVTDMEECEDDYIIELCGHIL
jgi:hypothetical protein